MPPYPYLIVGGGMTGDAAVRGIRELDAKGAIGLIGAEPDPPYARPPLSTRCHHGVGKVATYWTHVFIRTTISTTASR